MLRRVAALLALLLGLVLVASAQEQSGTRETPPAGRALPPAPDPSAASPPKPSASPPAQPADAARPGPSQNSGPRRAVPAANPVVMRSVARRLATGQSETSPRQDLAANRPALTAISASSLEAPAKLPSSPRPGRFAHDSGLHTPLDHAPKLTFALQPASQSPATANLSLPTSIPAGGPLVEIFGLHSSFAGQQHGALFAGQGARLSDSQGTSAPIELALPSGPPRMPQITLRPGLTQVAHGSSKQKVVALTFDDGPHPEYTSQLLSILDFYHIHATFFLVGVQAQKYPQWVKMIHQAGHEIGNHTYDHFRLPALPGEEVAYQIDENQRLLEQLTGVTPRFFRPPGGRYNDQAGRLLQQRGMLLALWDVALNDTAEDREAGDLYTTASHKIRPGSVVLGHDGIQATIDMLPQLIESLKKEGYSFVTMSELASGM